VEARTSRIGEEPVAKNEGAAELLLTERLVLAPITAATVEAVMRGDRALAEALLEAALPEAWPGAKLIHQGFGASLELVRADPAKRLWGDRVVMPRGERRVIGSVIFHGRPDDDGVAEVGYGIEEASRRRGFATEATRACVEWALAQPGVRAVTATTHPLNLASLRLIEKLGMRFDGCRDGGPLGDLLVFRIDR